MESKFKKKLNEMSPMTKGYIILIILLVIGIVLRWDNVSEGVIKGFKFFSK